MCCFRLQVELVDGRLKVEIEKLRVNVDSGSQGGKIRPRNHVLSEWIPPA
jgi:hypothetical protein